MCIIKFFKRVMWTTFFSVLALLCAYQTFYIASTRVLDLIMMWIGVLGTKGRSLVNSNPEILMSIGFGAVSYKWFWVGVWVVGNFWSYEEKSRLVRLDVMHDRDDWIFLCIHIVAWDTEISSCTGEDITHILQRGYGLTRFDGNVEGQKLDQWRRQYRRELEW